jgi:UDP-galactopyranose mutase
VNYPSIKDPFTRIIEYKKLYFGKSQHTTIAKEYPSWEGEPYYPIHNKANRQLYEKYKRFAEKSKDVVFVGRLANYKYFNMDQAIRNSLDVFNTIFLGK